MFQELLDVEHNIETLKIGISKWINVEKSVKDHNIKCIERNYIKKEKTPRKAN